MWTISKRPSSDGEWATIYRDWSEAKCRRQYMKYKANLSPGQALRLLHNTEVADETVAPPTRLTQI